jgi:hypothetical protein
MVAEFHSQIVDFLASSESTLDAFFDWSVICESLRPGRDDSCAGRAVATEVSNWDFWFHLTSGRYTWQTHSLTAPDPFAFTTATALPMTSGRGSRIPTGREGEGAAAILYSAWTLTATLESGTITELVPFSNLTNGAGCRATPAH